MKRRKITEQTTGENSCCLVPEVVAFGDAVLGEWCVQSCERVLGYTVLNVQVQVTLPLNVYSYLSTLREQFNKKRGTL